MTLPAGGTAPGVRRWRVGRTNADDYTETEPRAREMAAGVPHPLDAGGRNPYRRDAGPAR